MCPPGTLSLIGTNNLGSGEYSKGLEKASPINRCHVETNCCWPCASSAAQANVHVCAHVAEFRAQFRLRQTVLFVVM